MRDQALFDKIDLHLIRVLHTVLTDRSVSRAAIRLGMYQPAVSSALKRLRELAGDPLLVRSTIDLAHALGMEVTAEGVDTAAALALLKVMGCDIIQGFLISKPLGLDDLSRFLADENRLAHLDRMPIGFNTAPGARVK